MSASTRIPALVEASKVIDLLAVTLGHDKAIGAWEDGLRGVGLRPQEAFSRAQVSAVLDALSVAPGVVGVAGRFARLRLEQAAGAVARVSRIPGSGAGPTNAPPSPVTLSGAPPARDRPSDVGRGTRLPGSLRPPVDLLIFFAPSLGDEKAREALAHYGKLLNIAPAELTRPEAIKLLDAMSKASGLLGVVARFAKARFMLVHPARLSG